MSGIKIQARAVEQRLRDGAYGAEARGIYLDYIGPARAGADTISALLAALEAAEVDAARYRYCKDVMYADDDCCDDKPIDDAIAAGGTK